MTNRDKLIQALAQLDPAALEDVVTSAYRRRQEAEGASSQAPPESEPTPEQFAHWLARRHLSSDGAIERVVYLPSGSPDGVIRLLEVNRFLNPPDPAAVEPLDFTPDADPPFKVFVADVTADQWEQIKQAPDSILPSGWDLKDNQMITRG